MTPRLKELYYKEIQPSLKSQFGFILCISHIDAMRDAVDTLLEIKKENKFSNVLFD